MILKKKKKNLLNYNIRWLKLDGGEVEFSNSCFERLVASNCSKIAWEQVP